MKVEQISIFMENKSGRLAEVTGTLALAGVNIRALSLADTADFGILRLIVNNTERAKEILKSNGFTVGKTEVVAIEVPDRPGGLAEILDLDGGADPVELKGHLGNVTAAAFSPDGSRVATGDENGKILVSDAATGTPVFPAMQQAASVNGVAFRGDGRQLVTSSGADRLIHIWNLADNGRELLTISGHRDAVTQVAFTRDGREVISVSVDRTIRFWDAIQGRQVMILNGHKDQVFALALSPDGNRIATGGKDRTVRIWNISPEGSRELITFDVGSAVRDIALSPDGQHLLEGGADSIARVLNATSGQVLFTLTGHTQQIEGVAYSGDGKKILTCSRDSTAKVWDATSGKQLASFTEHTGPVLDCALSGDGKKAATA